MCTVHVANANSRSVKIGGEMVSMLALSAVDCGFEPW